jgi:hypothetical protein
LRPDRARKPPPALDGVIDAVDGLHKRVRREIERCESPRRGQGTALTGGWAKIGNRTQILLCATIEWIAVSEGLDAVDALRKESPHERTLEEASFLTLGRILKGFSRLEASRATPVHRIVHDVASRDSLFTRITRKRRDKVHEREEQAQLAQDLRELRGLDEFLRRVRDDLRQSSPHGTRGARS